MKNDYLNSNFTKFIGKKIMIISAHPDDDILGCGGLLAKIQNLRGFAIRVVFIGEGTTCRYSEKDHGSKKVESEINIRNKYATSSLDLLGVNNISFYNLKCGSLDTYPLIKIGKIIEDEIANFKPISIFTHSDNDLNNDHKIVLQSTLQATRPGALNFVKNIFSYEVISSSEWRFEKSFEPNFFLSLSKSEINKKIKSFKIYKSEIKKYPYARSEDSIKVLSRYRGIQSGVEFAEAFKIIRSLF